MEENLTSLKALEDIKQMMQQSSRFISLSGLSGVAAGICALVSAYYTSTKLRGWQHGDYELNRSITEGRGNLQSQLLMISIATFVAALALAFVFTYLRSQKTGTPIWNFTSRRLMLNVAIPMGVGGIFVYRMIALGIFGLVAPACLLFYGLALVNASKYTLGEVRYLGYGHILLGLINCWAIGYGLYFWAAGFGVLHIVYGLVMWYRYEAEAQALKAEER